MPLKLKFHTVGTRVSRPWNFGFAPRKLWFHTDETLVSRRGNQLFSPQWQQKYCHTAITPCRHLQTYTYSTIYPCLCDRWQQIFIFIL